MDITSNNINLFKRELQEMTKGLADKYGLKINMGSVTYSANEFHFKISAEKMVNGVNMGEKTNFERYCENYGFSKTNYLKKIINNGKVFRFTGFNNRRKVTTCAFSSVDDDNKQILMSPPLAVRKIKEYYDC